jgi:carbamoyl-phosphate synthase large subunit
MKKFRVIVTGSNSFGVGESIVKIVNRSRYRDDVELVCTSCYDMFYVGQLADEKHVIPSTDSNAYESSIKSLYRRGLINIIIPGSEGETAFFAECRETFPEFAFLMNDREIIRVFSDKLRAARLFPDYFPPTEERHQAFSHSQYPLVRKKRFGKGSEGITVMFGEQEIEEGTGFIFQQFIGGEEFTASLISQIDATLQMIVTRRVLRKGATVKAEVVREQGLEEWMRALGRKVIETIGPFKVLNLQFRRDHRDLKLLEVNPRISGSTSMRALFGYNEFDILLENTILNKTSPIINIMDGLRAVRGYEERIESD